MTGDDQEYFADYLKLEHYIEDLQAEHAAHLPTNLTPEQARVYRMASLFHSTSPEVPEATQPRPEFMEALQDRLLSISQEQGTEVSRPEEMPVRTDQEQSKDPQAAIEQPWSDDQTTTPLKRPRKNRSVSRRALLTGGAAAAASLAVGIGVGTAIEKSQSPQTKPQPQQPAAYKQEELIPSGPTTWLFVASFAQLSEQAVKFATDAITGYVILNDNDHDKDAPKEPVIALSAACTHMGCIVNWQDKNRQFQCPCHGGLFEEYGQPAKESPMRYLKPLPRLRTKIENGNVYVEVPVSNSSSPANKPS